MAVVLRNEGDYVGAHQMLYDAWISNSDFFRLQSDLSTFYVDLGMSDAAFAAATHTSTEGSVFALTGDMVEARRLASLDPDEYAHAALISGEDELAYWIFRDEATQVDFAGDTRFGLNQAYFFAEMAYILGTQDDPDADQILNKLEVLLTDHDPETFHQLGALLAGTAVHLMRDRHEMAAEWLTVAIGRGHAIERINHHPMYAIVMADEAFKELVRQKSKNARTWRVALDDESIAN